MLILRNTSGVDGPEGHEAQLLFYSFLYPDCIACLLLPPLFYVMLCAEAEADSSDITPMLTGLIFPMKLSFFFILSSVFDS